MQIERIAIAELSSDPANARKHGEQNISTIVASLKRFGQQKPIVIDSSDCVRAGNGTLEAARSIGWTHLDCVRTDLKGSDAIAYAIADNRTAELAEWDDDVLSATLNGLLADDPELLNAAGFSEEDLENLLGDIDGLGGGEVVEDEVPEVPVDPITKPGDLWILGRHRVLCGDSTKAEDVGRLMDGAKADLCFTSPPYANQRTYTKEGDLSTEYLARFIPAAQKYVDVFCVNLGIARQGGRLIRYWDDYILAAENAGLGLLSWNVWSRHGYGGSIGNMTAMFPIEHEWIFVFGSEQVEINRTVKNKHGGKQASATVRSADGDMSKSRTVDVHANGKLGSVFVSDVERGVKPHPAMFPVTLPVEYIKACTSQCGNVYEPFCGSGTTLIASEQLGRTCYGMEISPQYCDVIVKRWENLTGQKASLDDSRYSNGTEST